MPAVREEGQFKTCVVFSAGPVAVVKAVQLRYGLKSFAAAVNMIIHEFWQMKGGQL